MAEKDNNISEIPITSDRYTIRNNFERKLDVNYLLPDLPESFKSRLYLKDPEVLKKRKKNNKIPFFIPHKKLLEEIEYKREEHEPLSGFCHWQDTIKRKIRKDIRTELPEITTLFKKNDLKLPRPVKFQAQSRHDIKEKMIQENDTRYIKRPKPFIIDQLDLIKELREDPNNRFYYMTYAVDQSSEYFSPYALKIVQYKEIKKTYMTISVNGVTQYSPDEMIFTPIALWEKEYKYYLKLIKMKVFVTFRLWKSFYVWRKSISCRKFAKAKSHLEKTLFVTDPILETVC